MGKKKKFINKKNSATFQLFARDSADPNYGESDRVFIRVDNNPYSVNTFSDENQDTLINGGTRDDNDSIFADAPEDNDEAGGEDWSFGNSSWSQASAPLPEHVRKEILELGFPDDGYNYLIHMREIKNTGGGSAYYHNPKARLDQLPRDVKVYDATRVQISALSEAAPETSIYSVSSKTVNLRAQKVVDPEVAALLDESDLSQFGSDEEDLEEDFVVRANITKPEDVGTKDPSVGEQSEVGTVAVNDSASSGLQKQLGNPANIKELRNDNCKEEENYVDEIPRVRRLLDEQFDLLEHMEYGTDDDNDDCCGYVDKEDASLAEKLKNVLTDAMMDDLEFDDKYKVPADLLHEEKPKNKKLLESSADIIRQCAEYAKKYENEDQDDDLVVVEEITDESEAWDCETIISTYSNLDNHPGKIEAPEVARKKLAETISGALNSNGQVISLKGKERLPVDYLPHSRKPVSEKVKGAGNLRGEQQKRKQHGQESKEEKKERKAAVKMERREARRMKKEMKGLYRCEAQRAQKVAAISGPSSIHLM